MFKEIDGKIETFARKLKVLKETNRNYRLKNAFQYMY